MSTINIAALGGLQERGKNLYIIEVDNDLFILDAGFKYPTSELYGVDRIVPDYSYLIENEKRIKAIFLSHGHDTHIGGLIHILKDINVDIYSTKFTNAVLKDLLLENDIDVKKLKLHIIKPEDVIKFDNGVSVSFFSTTHNVPESVGIVVNTKDGCIAYTANYTFDQNAKEYYKTDYGALINTSKKNVLCLLTESQGSLIDQNRGTILELMHRLNNIFQKAKGRLIFSLFSSDLLRIQQVVDLALTYNKRIAIIGRKTQRIVNIAINLGYLSIPSDRLVNLRYIDEKNSNDDSDLIVLVTGERHEPYFMLQRMSKKIDRLIKIDEKDTVVIMTKPYAGTEKMAAKTLDLLYRYAGSVSVMGDKLLIASAATREEIKQMINILKPQYVVPVIGEFRHLTGVKTIVECLGLDGESVIYLDNGEVLQFKDGKKVGIVSEINVGETLIDGDIIGDVNDAVLRDRQLLSEDGVLLIASNINPKTRKILSGPEIVTKGFIFTKENEELVEKIKEIFYNTSQKHLQGKFINWSDYKNDIKNDVNRFLYKTTKRNPVIIPVVISTDKE